MQLRVVDFISLIKMFTTRHHRKPRLMGSHGGAWKVAYADFVTGMMSLFLVLWILSQDEEVIIATTRFFRDPYKAGVPKSTPVEQKDARPGSMVDQIVGRSDTTMRNTDDTTSIDIDVLHRIAQDWFQRLKLHEIDDSTMQIEATSEGLKVTLFHGDEKPLFAPSSSELTNHGRKVMQRMSWLLAQHVLVYRVDSHTNHLTDGKRDATTSNAWTMSLEQGAEVTDALVHYSAGELDGKLERITGHGSTKPNDIRYPNQTEKNRRVELSLVLDMSKEDLAQYQ
jgi:chemotaxis protein MotB